VRSCPAPAEDIAQDVAVERLEVGQVIPAGQPPPFQVDQPSRGQRCLGPGQFGASVMAADHEGLTAPLLAAVVIGLTGSGASSLDQLAGISWPAPVGLAGGAAGVLAGLCTLRWLRSGQPTGEGSSP